MRQPSIRALLAAGGITAAATIRAVHSMDSAATLILVLTGLAILLAIAAVIHRRVAGQGTQTPADTHNHYPPAP